MKRASGFVALPLLILAGCTEQQQQPASNPSTQTSPATSSNSSQPIPTDGKPPQVPQHSVVNKDQTPSPTTEKSAGDAMSLYREAQTLMKDGKRNEGYETAKQAMQQFIAQKDDLASMLLETIKTDGKRIDVHFNMGSRERNMPDFGIVRPLSFHIFADGEKPELLRVIDFELGRGGGQTITAAIGEQRDTTHANFGILKADDSYETIRKAVLDIISKL